MRSMVGSSSWKSREFESEIDRNPSRHCVPHLTREDRRSLALHERIADRLRAAPVETVARAEANLRRMRDLHPGASELLERAGARCRVPGVPARRDAAMNRAQFEHAVRAAAAVAGEHEVIVIGSQAVHAWIEEGIPAYST